VIGPAIPSVSDGDMRPTWSVMIPTFNSERFLAQALESVLLQAPPAKQMQIDVVDDCSVVDPRPIVERVGKGRVACFRNPRNLGLAGNFNACIERSRGQLVHILHADDLVLPGYYKTIEATARDFPAAALFATRVFFCDVDGVIELVSPRLPSFEKGPGRDLSDFAPGNPLQCPAVTVRRSFYEQHGGFLPELAYTLDWEMWVRAVALAGAVVRPQVLAVYRTWEGNHTHELARSAECLRDIERFAQLMQTRHAGFPADRIRAHVRHLARQQEMKFRARGDEVSAQAARRFWMARSNTVERVRSRISSAARQAAALWAGH
jgi:hypothetical protein